jgi:NitT/TauT family transport system ATP-binding protein
MSVRGGALVVPSNLVIADLGAAPAAGATFASTTAKSSAPLSVRNVAKRFVSKDRRRGDRQSVLRLSRRRVCIDRRSVGLRQVYAFPYPRGLLSGYEGTVVVGNDVIRGPHPSVGMVFQEESTFPWRSVIDNVAFPLQMRGMGKAERLESARHLIAMVGLQGFEDRFPKELSGGMRQRVSIARILASQPRILLMDEPFAALDEQTRLLLGEKVLAIQEELHQTTLLITHSLSEAVQLSDRVLVMTYRPGRLKRVVNIALPRPRSTEVLTSPEFGTYVARLWHDLRDEASRGLAAAETSSEA